MFYEKIIDTEILIYAFNKDNFLKDGKRVVILECGHYAYTNSIHGIHCLRCKEMYDRSIIDGSEDYDAFKKGLKKDNMVWENDLCRIFNETTDAER